MKGEWHGLSPEEDAARHALALLGTKAPPHDIQAARYIAEEVESIVWQEDDCDPTRHVSRRCCDVDFDAWEEGEFAAVARSLLTSSVFWK